MYTHKNESKYNTKNSHKITGGKKICKNECKTINKMAIGMYKSIITLNVIGLPAPTKTQAG